MDSVVQEELLVQRRVALLDGEERVTNRCDLGMSEPAQALVQVVLVDMGTLHGEGGKSVKITKSRSIDILRLVGMGLHNDGSDATLLEDRTVGVVESSECFVSCFIEAHALGLISKNYKVPGSFVVKRLLVLQVRVFLEARVLAIINERTQSITRGYKLIMSSQKLWYGASTHIIEVRCVAVLGFVLDATDHCVLGGPSGPHTVSSHDDFQDTGRRMQARILEDVSSGNIFNETREIVDVEVRVSDERHIYLALVDRGISAGKEKERKSASK
mmetsp:Transcript_941/g.1700  ORF Transcript_941/g.1700 Transcript_941/m.1700 type:complete len:272 (-) Transcript_941:442-1257(-)